MARPNRKGPRVNGGEKLPEGGEERTSLGLEIKGLDVWRSETIGSEILADLIGI